jgi:hypothetical protein
MIVGMASDIAVCEWTPNSNRATVDPVVAVARLDIPAATRVALIEKMKRHHFDDVVKITWASITSNSGAYRYGNAISNMNFATGRICRAITRNKWSASDEEGSIVYIVGERAFGFASACGNLFELELTEAPAAPAADGPGPAALVLGPVGGPEETTLDVSIAGLQVPEAETLGAGPSAGAPGWPAFGWIGGPGYYCQQCCVPPAHIPAVPEPSTALYLLGGLAMLYAVRRRAAA